MQFTVCMHYSGCHYCRNQPLLVWQILVTNQVGWSVLVCAFVCAFVSASECSLRGLFACVLSWVEILGTNQQVRAVGFSITTFSRFARNDARASERGTEHTRKQASGASTHHTGTANKADTHQQTQPTRSVAEAR